MLFLAEMYLLRERAERMSRELFDSASKKRKDLLNAGGRLTECQKILDEFSYVEGVDPPKLKDEWTHATVGVGHYGRQAERLRRNIQQLEDDRFLAEEDWKQLNSELASTTGLRGDIRETADEFYKGMAKQLLDVAQGADRRLVQAYLEAIEYTQRSNQFMERLNGTIARGEVDTLKISDFSFFIDTIVSDYRRQVSENKGLAMETEDLRRRKGYRREARHAQKRLDRWESVKSVWDLFDVAAEEEHDFVARQSKRDTNVAALLDRQDLTQEDIKDIQSAFPNYSFYVGIEAVKDKYADQLAGKTKK